MSRVEWLRPVLGERCEKTDGAIDASAIPRGFVKWLTMEGRELVIHALISSLHRKTVSWRVGGE